MIYDCFSYWDEDLLLDLRLNILDNYVDYFVIVEGNKTWQNNPKKLRFEIDKFKKFKNKIIYVPVTDLPDGEDPYLRENHQRNAIVNGLNNANDNDLIIISDLDEIPDPKKINLFNPKKRYAVFKQKHFYYKFNLLYENYTWQGTKAVKKKNFISPQWLRNIKGKKYSKWRIDTFFSKKKYRNIINLKYFHIDSIFNFYRNCGNRCCSSSIFKQSFDFLEFGELPRCSQFIVENSTVIGLTRRLVIELVAQGTET